MRRLVLAALVAAVFLLGWVARDLSGPDCPTEDSCTVDYRDHRWHIDPTTP